MESATLDLYCGARGTLSPRMTVYAQKVTCKNCLLKLLSEEEIDMGQKKLRTGPVTIDHDRGEVLVFGKPAQVAPSQYKVLRALIDADGKILSRATLLKVIYNGESDSHQDSRSVDQCVHRIRDTIGKASVHLKTVCNRGYRWALR